MDRKQFTFFASYLDAVEDFPKEQRGIFFDAVIMYSLRDLDPVFSADDILAKAVFTAIKPVLDNSKKKARSGRTGGKKKAKPKQTVSKTEAKPKQTVSYRKGKERKGVEKDRKRNGENNTLQLPSSFSKKDLEDLIAHRKALKAPLTQRALNGIVAQFKESGLSVSECIDEMANRGWKGFKADWVSKDKKGGQNGTRKKGGYTEATPGKDYDKGWV